MISLQQFERQFFSRLKLLSSPWDMSPFVFAKEISYEGSSAQEMILHWAQRGLIELKAFDKTIGDWKFWDQYTRNVAVFSANNYCVRVSLTARGEEDADKL